MVMMLIGNKVSRSTLLQEFVMYHIQFMFMVFLSSDAEEMIYM